MGDHDDRGIRKKSILANYQQLIYIHFSPLNRILEMQTFVKIILVNIYKYDSIIQVILEEM